MHVEEVVTNHCPVHAAHIKVRPALPVNIAEQLDVDVRVGPLPHVRVTAAPAVREQHLGRSTIAALLREPERHGEAVVVGVGKVGHGREVPRPGELSAAAVHGRPALQLHSVLVAGVVRGPRAVHVDEADVKVRHEAAACAERKASVAVFEQGAAQFQNSNDLTGFAHKRHRFPSQHAGTTRQSTRSGC